MSDDDMSRSLKEREKLFDTSHSSSSPVKGTPEIETKELGQHNKTRNRSQTPRKSPSSTVTRSRTTESSEKASSSAGGSGLYYYLSVIAGVVGIIIFYNCLTNNQNSNGTIKAKLNCSQFMDLTKNFPNQDKLLFKSLKIGIEGIVNSDPSKPSVFSIFSTDSALINNLMEEVVKITKQCINQTNDPINLSKDEINEKLVTNYKDELSKRTIMIIRDVDKIAPGNVKVLHSFCDTYNPLVEKSIIFLTIHVPGSPKGKPIDYIREHLNDQWESLADNVRNPLITRMLDQTFYLKPFN
ncbi:CLUMA_CG004016, isoform A [Clunio marinus]|uniref:CLUMA_CG004016, isoform A n=1 Tax=Clunio marinus TaxID=568069 RepID=A0A1J1HS95_9DIPT|nr:CLUMA_CG004016, isoform A [Clunio marinus]